jgi:2-C-methyl-D-erythritol 2,4-cyclodiphosphate synthase
MLIGRAGFRVVNLDSTIIAQAPKLAPHIQTIRKSLADALGVSLDVANVKAKTNEGLDAIGRGEAIAAHAIVLLRSTD